MRKRSFVLQMLTSGQSMYSLLFVECHPLIPCIRSEFCAKCCTFMPLICSQVAAHLTHNVLSCTTPFTTSNHQKLETLLWAGASNLLLPYACAHNSNRYVVYSKGATFFANINEVHQCEANHPAWFTNPGDITNNKNISENLLDGNTGAQLYQNSTAGTWGVDQLQ